MWLNNNPGFLFSFLKYVYNSHQPQTKDNIVRYGKFSGFRVLLTNHISERRLGNKREIHWQSQYISLTLVKFVRRIIPLSLLVFEGICRVRKIKNITTK